MILREGNFKTGALSVFGGRDADPAGWHRRTFLKIGVTALQWVDFAECFWQSDFGTLAGALTHITLWELHRLGAPANGGLHIVQ